MTWKYAHDKMLSREKMYPWYALNYVFKNHQENTGITQESVNNDYLSALWDWVIFFFNLYHTSQLFYNEHSSLNKWEKIKVM